MYLTSLDGSQAIYIATTPFDLATVTFSGVLTKNKAVLYNIAKDTQMYYGLISPDLLDKVEQYVGDLRDLVIFEVKQNPDGTEIVNCFDPLWFGQDGIDELKEIWLEVIDEADRRFKHAIRQPD